DHGRVRSGEIGITDWWIPDSRIPNSKRLETPRSGTSEFGAWGRGRSRVSAQPGPGRKGLKTGSEATTSRQKGARSFGGSWRADSSNSFAAVRRSWRQRDTADSP